MLDADEQIEGLLFELFPKVVDVDPGMKKAAYSAARATQPPGSSRGRETPPMLKVVEAVWKGSG